MNFPNHQLAMIVLMTPDMANFAGNVHGGTILKLLDQVAYACASRYAGRYVVTLSVDQVTFRQPIHVGELGSISLIGFDGVVRARAGVHAAPLGADVSASPLFAAFRSSTVGSFTEQNSRDGRMLGS